MYAERENNRSGARCEAGPAGDEATLHQSN